MTDQLRALSALRCRAVSVPLGPGPAPEEVLRRAAGSDGLVCLVGSWAGGGAVLAAEPLLVLDAGADHIAALGRQPRVEPDPAVLGGGWFGWLGYDGPSRLAFYDHLLRYDGAGSWSFEALWSAERDALLQARHEELAELLAGPDARPSWQVGAFDGPSLPEHLRAVERAVELIRAGEIYQVNVCTRFGAAVAGSTAGLFADAAAALQPAFGAYVETAGGAVASLSPELFLRRRGREVMTSPIKGTWPRPADDTAGADALRHSAKDAAENVMIVDLMRNDLGRVSEIGSVRAASLLDVQAHPGVWHLVSTVSGRLRDDVGDEDLLRAAFPPGSVTGAPKLRAVEAIAALESGPRGAYTGAIGFASPSWGLEFNVAIRTFEIHGGRIELGVGGGITADSVPMLEWRECLHKATPLLGALGARTSVAVPAPQATPTQLSGGLFESVLVAGGRPLRLADHLARLERSCRELYGFGLPLDVAVRVHAAIRADRLAVRILVRTDGEVTVATRPAPVPPRASSAQIERGRTGLWRHKWTERTFLDAAEAATSPDLDAVPLFVADDGTVLETSRGNVFLLAADGTLTTPPLRDDLLPGVTRRALLDLARDTGRPTELRQFGIGELTRSAAFWTSSLSGVVPIHAVDGVALPHRDEEVAALSALLI
ncbi:MAG: Chorismate binding-like protein [Pseudonocardiales bacterium]|nr:Chorismate binding-like protein [Pseudonocardiales bacterium]